MNSNFTIDPILGELPSLPLKSDRPELVSKAVPFFFLLIFIELAFAAYKKQKNYYRLNDSISSISSAVLSEWIPKILTNNWFKIMPYAFLYEHYRLCTLPDGSWAATLACIFAVDLCYYVGHRTSHTFNLQWSGHSVHHSSEAYNLSTALRQGSFESLLTWQCFLPCALLGFSPSSYLLWRGANTISQFWVHTEQVHRLWWPLELVFNSPHAHRIHHARNPEYLDKNYAGMFIIWDRLFGTYVEETVKPVYGLVHPLETWDPLFIQFAHFPNVWRAFWAAPGALNKFGTLAYGPGWYYDANVKQWREHEIPEVQEGIVYNKHVDWHRFPNLMIYMVLSFAADVTWAFLPLVSGDHFSAIELLVLFALICWALYALAGFSQMTRSTRGFALRASELTRLFVTWVVGAQLLQKTPRADIAPLLHSAFGCTMLALIFTLLVTTIEKEAPAAAAAIAKKQTKQH